MVLPEDVRQFIDYDNVQGRNRCRFEESVEDETVIRAGGRSWDPRLPRDVLVGSRQPERRSKERR